MDHEAYLAMAQSEDLHWWFRGRRRILKTLIRRLRLPAQARLLEVGSGTGGNLAMLGAFGNVTAVELNETARKIAETKTGGRYEIQAGALPDRMPPSSEKFDLICLFDVLEHVEEDEQTLAVLYDYLAPGGTLLITVPAFRRLWGQHDVGLHHKRRYEKAELKAKLEAAGYRIERLSFMNMALFPVAVLARFYDRLRPRETASGSGTPPWILNESFAALFGAEALALPFINLPIGLSLLASVKRR